MRVGIRLDICALVSPPLWFDVCTVHGSYVHGSTSTHGTVSVFSALAVLGDRTNYNSSTL